MAQIWDLWQWQLPATSNTTRVESCRTSSFPAESMGEEFAWSRSYEVPRKINIKAISQALATLEQHGLFFETVFPDLRDTTMK